MFTSQAGCVKFKTGGQGPTGGALALGWLAQLVALVSLALLVGCAGPQVLKVGPGQTEAEMLAVMGSPSGRYPLPDGGQRVEYAKGPMGRVTFMFDLDSSGRIKTAEQVLTPQNFAKVRPDMNRDEVQLILGRPGARQREYMDKETWSWRYETFDCLWAQVTFNAANRVMGGVAYLPDPRCDASR
ncbi:MAG: outer membrane protein assembly factor BamE [Microbacteriaceae bacterium]|nr:outer membrane protein assembly factor BamE [Burkholderiaceae bacterium]